MKHFFISFVITTMFICMVAAFYKIERDALSEGYYASAPLFSYTAGGGQLRVSLMGVGGTIPLYVPEGDNLFLNTLRSFQRSLKALQVVAAGMYEEYRYFIFSLIYS